MSAIVATEEQVELRSAVRAAVDQSAGPRPVLAEEPSGRWFDAELTNALNAELGLADLMIPEELGGAGGTIGDAAAVFEELGAALAPVPLFATMALGVPALMASPGEVATELLGRIGRGEIIVTLADGRCGLAEDHQVEARHDAGVWALTGRSGVVIEGGGADVLLVVATTSAGPSLFAVEEGATGVTRRSLPSVDLLRGLAEIELDSAPARLVGAEACAEKAVELAWDIAMVLQAAEQVGGAQKVLDTAVEYAKTREQFDQKIGSFQQISSTLVDLLLDVEMCRSLLIRAIDTAQDYLAGGDEASRRALSLEASMAKDACSDAYAHVADQGLHVLGGIGFTWEHDAHLYFRRAMSTRQLLGSPDAHRDRMAGMAGL
jgi:alkylation response protein AidB-like acyl-CoA dehydrogenase